MSMNSARAPAMSALYSAQRMPQHGYPGPPQGQQVLRQSIKRTYSSEVSTEWGKISSFEMLRAGLVCFSQQAAAAGWLTTGKLEARDHRMRIENSRMWVC